MSGLAILGYCPVRCKIVPNSQYMYIMFCFKPKSENNFSHIFPEWLGFSLQNVTAKMCAWNCFTCLARCMSHALTCGFACVDSCEFTFWPWLMWLHMLCLTHVTCFDSCGFACVDSLFFHILASCTRSCDLTCLYSPRLMCVNAFPNTLMIVFY